MSSSNIHSFHFEGTSSFIPEFTQFYREGASLCAVTKLCLKSLQNTHMPDLQTCLRMRELCVLAIAAKEEYYRTSVIGKLSFCFEKVMGTLFGCKTTLQKANDALEKIDTLIDKSPLGLAQLSYDLAIRWAPNKINAVPLNNGATLSTLGETTNPQFIYITKPNGEIYIISRLRKNLIAGVSERSVYQGYLRSMSGSLKKVAIVTTFPRYGLDFELCDPIKVSKASRNMAEEANHLRAFNQEEIVKIRDHYQMQYIEGDEAVDIGFTIVDFFEQGDLDTFLSSKELNVEQRYQLAKSLLSSLSAIHRKGKIHRDIKEKNILISVQGEKMIPTFIDFESCIDAKDTERKNEISATPKYWPPEYLQIYHEKGKEFKNLEESERENRIGEHLVDVTTPAMDVWALGIVLYRVKYNKSFFDAICPGFNGLSESAQTAKLKEIYNSNYRAKAFAHVEQWDELDVKICAMLDPNPKIRYTNLSQYS